MARRFVVLLAFAALCHPASFARAAIILPPNFVDDTIVTGLDQPNAMAFLPDGRLLITELKTGKIRMVVNGHIAATDPMMVADSVTTAEVERGLQGIAVDPRWPQMPYVYAAYTHVGNRMSLVRYTATGDITNPTGENLQLSSKRTLIHDLWDQAWNHNGLGLRFGTDGMLLMTVGDDDDRCQAQVSGSLRGKMLRLDVTRIPAGGGGPVPRAILIPPNNPLSGPDSNSMLMYAQGLRNPWRFSVDAMTGAILLGDVGEDTYEEVDEIFAGHNYGWPFREGPMIRTWPGCSESGNYDAPLISLDRVTGYTAVLTAGVYRPPTGGAATWPSVYNGNLFYGDYFQSRLRRLVRQGATWVPAASIPGQANAQDWATGMYFCVDFAIGPDGSLYWLKAYNDAMTDRTGMVKRIRYTGTVDVAQDRMSGHLLSAAPNPFSERVELHWRIPSAGPVTIEVLDIGGRRVHRFVTQGSLEGRWSWDGRDDRGVRVAAGQYVARMIYPGGVARVRFSRLN